MPLLHPAPRVPSTLDSRAPGLGAAGHTSCSSEGSPRHRRPTDGGSATDRGPAGGLSSRDGQDILPSEMVLGVCNGGAGEESKDCFTLSRF